jgi:DivIVA protein
VVRARAYPARGVSERDEQRQPDEGEEVGPETQAFDPLTPDPETYAALSKGQPDPPPRVRAEFPVVFRGYDREVVDAHLAGLEEDVLELHANSSPAAAVKRELDRIGHETSAILQRAHEAADEVTRSSRAQADARLEEAEREAERIIRDARARLERIDKDTDEVWADRRKLLEDVKAMGESLVRLAEQAIERFPPADDGGPPAQPTPAAPPAPQPKLAEVPPPEPAGEGGGVESVRKIPRPGAPRHPKGPRSRNA